MFRSLTLSRPVWPSVTESSPGGVYNPQPQGFTVSRESPDDPKEKDNETFAKGVTAVGRFGRYIRICCYPQGSPRGTGPDASVPTKAPELRRIVALPHEVR